MRGWQWLCWTNTTLLTKPRICADETYRLITGDPTTKHKNKLIQILRTIKAQGGLSDATYKRFQPTSKIPPYFMDSPNPQIWHPFRPIVSKRDMVNHGVAKELANIIRPMVGHSPQHIRNSQHFIECIKAFQLYQGEYMASYHINTLFIPVPVKPAISMIKNKLQQNPLLLSWTSMPIQHIITLLEFCLKNTYFFFQGKYFEQVCGTAMGSPVSAPSSQPVHRRVQNQGHQHCPQSIQALA